jgi:hypothetical protein
VLTQKSDYGYLTHEMIVQIIPVIDFDVRSKVSEDKSRYPAVDITTSLVERVDGEVNRNKLPNVNAEILKDLREHPEAGDA